MTDEGQRTGRDRLIAQTIPGWFLLTATVFVVVTRDGVSETLVGTMLGFAIVLLVGPVALAKRG